MAHRVLLFDGGELDCVLIGVKQRLVTGRLHLGHERAFDWSVGDGVVRGAGCACAASVLPQPIGGAFAGHVGEGHVDPGVGAGVEAGEQQHDVIASPVMAKRRAGLDKQVSHAAATPNADAVSTAAVLECVAHEPVTDARDHSPQRPKSWLQGTRGLDTLRWPR